MDNVYQIKQIENNNYHKVKTYTEAVIEKGISPYIGENGNWFEYDDELGKAVDTGIKARGDNGKSAYEIAVEEGFEGSVKSWLVSLKGADGISPTVETEQTETGATIYITDRLGVKSAIIKNGKDFTYDMFTPEQLNSLKGQDGYSPTAKVKQTSNGARITITDKEQTTTADIQNGKTPVKGVDYFTDSDIESIVNQTKSEITIPTKLSQLEEDSEHKTVSDNEINNWNNKSSFSGSYNDLTDKPTIPNVDNKLDKPVNMPSVGNILVVKQVNDDGTFLCEWANKENKFELIETVVLDKDMPFIDKATEPNGLPYNFSALYLYMDIEPATNTSSLSVVVNNNKNLCNQYAIIHDKKIYTYVYSKIVNGYLDTVYPTNVYTFQNAATTINKANFNPETIFNVESINKIRIIAAKVSGDGEAYIPQGSSIQIWGVRK